MESRAPNNGPMLCGNNESSDPDAVSGIRLNLISPHLPHLATFIGNEVLSVVPRAYPTCQGKISGTKCIQDRQ